MTDQELVAEVKARACALRDAVDAARKAGLSVSVLLESPFSRGVVPESAFPIVTAFRHIEL